MHRIADIDIVVDHRDPFQRRAGGDQTADLFGMTGIDRGHGDDAMCELATEGQIDMHVAHRFVAVIMAELL
jgi:hypothetical protein